MSALPSRSPRRGTTTRPPADILRDMAGGFVSSQVLHTAVVLGLPDHLADRVVPVRRLATLAGAKLSPLRRFLRMMTVLGLVEERGSDRFALSPLGNLLRTDHPASHRDRIRYIGKVVLPASMGMTHAVRTGSPAFDKIFGEPFFAYLGRDREAGSLFNEMMRQSVDDRISGILDAYDFGAIGSLLDVGGGSGALVDAILRRSPGPTGAVFDARAVVAEARLRFRKSGLTRRTSTVAGDFFVDAVPEGYDLYILSHIIHDWDDERSIRILRNCRAAMKKGSRLLVIEGLLPKASTTAPATVAMDFSMLMLTGGRERTATEYRKLFKAAGLRLTRTLPFRPGRLSNGRLANWAILECEGIPGTPRRKISSRQR